MAKTAKSGQLMHGHQAVGKVAIIYGHVKAISADGTVRILKANSLVYADDRIITESDGSVSIIMDSTPPIHLDLGRMTEVALDEDVYGGAGVGVTAEAAAEAEAIRQALLAGNQPIQPEAPAAGGEADAGGGHPVVNFSLTGEEVNPTSGAETRGITFATPDIIKGISTPDSGVFILDLKPAIEGGDATVDEDELLASRDPGESEGTDHSGNTMTTGSFTVIAPDGLDSVSINGTLVISGGVPTGNIATTPLGNSVAITSYDPATGIISYKFTLNDNETHANGDGENPLFEEMTVTASDTDGDTATGTLSIKIVDDVPSASLEEDVKLRTLTLDESDEPVTPENPVTDDGIDDGIRSVTANFEDNFDTPVYGADGPGSVSYTLSLTGTDVNSGLYALGVGGAQGAQIVLNQSGNTITGSAGGTNYFTISINPSTGDVTFTQLDNIWHDDAGETPAVEHDDAGSLNLEAGTIMLTQTVTDADFDEAHASLDLSTRVFRIEDDGPSANLADISLDTLLLDESDEPGTPENPVADDGIDDGIRSVTANFADNFDTPDYGTDGPGSVNYALSLSSTEPFGSGLYALDPTNTADVGKGDEIMLSMDGDDIVGKVGDAEYFRISVDDDPASPDFGSVTFTQSGNIWHDDAGETPADEHDDPESLNLEAGTIVLTQTVTDADGDTAEASLDLSTGVFSIEDDGPSANLADISLDTLLLDESDEPGTPENPVTDDGIDDGIRSVTANFADNFDTPDYGTDGPGSVNYALSLSSTEPFGSGLYALDPTNTADVGKGDEIMLSMDGDDIVGKVGDAEYFRISVDDDPASPDFGSVTFTQSGNIWHDDAGETPADEHDDAESLNLEEGSIVLTQTVTDADGDTAEASLDLSTGVFSIEDDGPTANTAEAALDTLVLDETRPVGSETDGDSDPAGRATVTADFSDNFGTPDYGTDGEGSESYAWSLTGTDVNSGLYALGVGGARGDQIVLNQSGDTITGSVGGTDYFTISIDSNTGVVTFTQLANIWHSSTASDDDTATLTLSNANLLQLVQTVTDADGDSDTASLNLGQGVFSIEDDGPTASNYTGDTFAEGSGSHIIGDAATLLGISAGEDGLQGTLQGIVFTNQGTTGGALSINGLGQLIYTSPTNVTSSTDVTETFLYSVTDKDGDSVTKEVTFKVSDTGVSEVSATNELVDEDDIVAAPAGNAGGPGDDAPLTTGHISYTLGADALQGITLSVASTGLTKLDGTAVNTSWNSTTNTLTGWGTSTSDVVFTIHLNNITSTGADYDTTLYQPVTHPVHDDPGTKEATETAFEDNLGFTVNVSVKDVDNSEGTTSFQVTIDDDTPVFTDAEDTLVNNKAGSSVNGDLNFSIGEDQPVAGDALSLLGNTAPLNLTSGGIPVSYYVDPANPDTLIAYTGADPSIPANQVFTLVVNESGSYDFTVLKTVDNTALVPIDGATAFGTGPAASQILLGAAQQLAILTGWKTDAGWTADDFNNWQNGALNADHVSQAYVNGTNEGWGVGSANLDAGELFRIDFDDFDAFDTLTVSPGFDGPAINFATIALPHFQLSNDIAYVVHYTDGTIDSDTGSIQALAGDDGVMTVGQSGKFIDYIELMALEGNGKFDLVSVSTVTTLGELNLPFNVTVKDADGDTAAENFTVSLSNHFPSIDAGAATILADEDGLAGGNANGDGDLPTESLSGVLSGLNFGSDGPGDIVLTASANIGFSTLTDHAIETVWDGTTHTLTGQDSVTGNDIFTLQITDIATGAYSFHLQAPVKHTVSGTEDDKTFNVTATVTDANGDTATGTISVLIDDDTPAAQNISNDETVSTTTDTNLLITLDISGSMGEPTGVGGLTKLELAKTSIMELFEQYDALGNVMVKMVTFSATAQIVGTGWMTIADAKVALTGLTTQSTTNYDDALLKTMQAFDQDGKIVGGQNVEYFLSDGIPNVSTVWPGVPGSGGSGINGAEEGQWENFLEQHDIKSYALGMGSAADGSKLNPIAYDAMVTPSVDTNAIVVTDLSQLTATLVSTVHASPISGYLGDSTGAVPADYGADGGHVQSITVDGTTHNYDAAHPVQTFSIASGGTIQVNFITGYYTYTPPSTITGVINNDFGYSLVDNDGDMASATLHITIDPASSPFVVRDDVVIASYAKGDTVSIPDWALLANDTPPEGKTQAITGIISSNGAQSVTHSASSVLFDDDGTSGGSFVYTNTAGTVSDTSNVTVARDGDGTITGTWKSEILIDSDSNGTLNGEEGNDILIGNAGNDTLNGGEGNDLLAGGAGTDILNGGNGSDTAIYIDAGSAVTVNLNTTIGQNTGGAGTDTLNGIENLIGSNYDDTLTGNSGANILAGGAGNDTLNGGSGDDLLVGGFGDDMLTGGNGADTFVTGVGNDHIVDYSKTQSDLVDISDVVDYGAGDQLSVMDDGTGHVKLVIEDASHTAKGSVTFDNISYNDLTPGNELDSLLGKVDIDDGTP